MRERPVDEHPYPYYFSEQFKEQLSLRYRIWSVSGRQEYQGNLYHSTYLDHLQAKKEADDPSYPRDNPGNHIDANFAHYTRLKRRDHSRWLRFIAKYHEQSCFEAECMAESIVPLSTKPRKPTVTRMARLLSNVLEPIGFECILRDTKRKRLIYRKPLGKDIALFVESHDYSPGQGGSLVYIFQPLEFPI